MASTLRYLRLLADPSRLRILLLVAKEELSVAELQDILGMGQSRISTHLAQMKQGGLLEDRREGKNIYYAFRPRRGAEAKSFARLLAVLEEAASEIPEAEDDARALGLAMRRRQDKVRAYFDELAGKFGRHYVPGRSWKGLAETLLTLMPPMVIADLGAGEGTFSQLLARRAKKVIAIDNSEKMVEYGEELARKHGVANLEYRLGDIQKIPIRTGTVDLAFFSQALHHAQHPERAVTEAHRILRPGGRIVVLDLLRHGYQEAKDLYADVWLGFTEAEVVRFLVDAGFRHVETSIVHREEESPHFQTLLMVGDRP
ncbi:MAG TPA: metalloregulator ArsR/SmtB family transcription factor [Bryobacteraceae bacterium]|nr:metalloregulator ArsR/SmtB family transcription factor [Bryobacteraceae bacterium]